MKSKGKNGPAKYWQLLTVMVKTLCKMWTIKWFQNKKSARLVTAPLIPPEGMRRPWLPANSSPTREPTWSVSEVKAPPPQSPAKARIGGAGISNDWCIKYVEPGGEGVLPYQRLMGMCRWMGSHFHDWIDYHGVAFSTIARMGTHIFSFLGKTVLHIYG